MRCQRAGFPPSPLPPAPPSAPLPVAPSSESRHPDPFHTVRLPAPAPGAITHPNPTSRGPEPPCGKTPASLRPASAPLTIPHAGPEAAGRKQSGRESQPQAPDTPCPLSALRASCVHRDLKNIIASSPEGYTTHILTDKAI